MKSSIEQIWKEGFLKENSLVAPKINDLYNQKSTHLVEQMKRKFRMNQFAIVSMALMVPLAFLLIDAFWPGVAASVLFLFLAWYNYSQLQKIRSLDYGATSLDYLKSFDRWLDEVLSKSKKIARIYYPLCFLVAVNTIWSVWNKHEAAIMKARQAFHDSHFIGNVPVFIIVILAIATAGMVFISSAIYRWDVQLSYGYMRTRLKQMITEMESLR
jgi:hypothetical protein